MKAAVLAHSNDTEKLGKLSLSRLVAAAAVMIIGASVLLSWHSNTTLQELRVGGPQYVQIAAGKDFVADILPPPLFPVEAFAIAQALAGNPDLLTEKKPFLDGLRQQFETRLNYWLIESGDLRFLQGDVKQKFEKDFRELGQRFWEEIFVTLLPAAERRDQTAMGGSITRLTGQYEDFRSQIDGTLPGIFESIAASEAEAVAEAKWQATMGLVLAVIAGSLISGLVLASFPLVVRPIQEVTGLLTRLASGGGSDNQPYDIRLGDRRKRKRTAEKRRDEIGQLARAAITFKAITAEAQRLSKEQDDARIRAAEEGHRLQDEAIAKERGLVTESIGTGLMKLAAKDLTYRLSGLPEAYARLEQDFNAAMVQLEEAMTTVSGSTVAISKGTREISAASDDLSRRTETQAANIEETAAAVAEITQTVKQTAAGAQQASEVVAAARDEASRSSEIVRNAVDAMSDIEKSSQQITQIIGVIDEIAFQTSLLALNAGVEAARAGDAGRGFAVVASEVRALAQRSADAAKEIKNLLGASRTQVERGVDMVAATGTSLEKIVERVVQVNEVVAEIAASAQSQAAGLQEVNTAVGQMDQTTQQNAAMVEQSTAATRILAQQSQDLAGVVASFTTRTLRAMVPEGRDGPTADPIARARLAKRG